MLSPSVHFAPYSGLSTVQLDSDYSQAGWRHGFALSITKPKEKVCVIVLVVLLYLHTARVMRLVHSFAVSTLAPSGPQSTPPMLNVHIPPPYHARTQLAEAECGPLLTLEGAGLEAERLVP